MYIYIYTQLRRSRHLEVHLRMGRIRVTDRLLSYSTSYGTLTHRRRRLSVSLSSVSLSSPTDYLLTQLHTVHNDPQPKALRDRERVTETVTETETETETEKERDRDRVSE